MIDKLPINWEWIPLGEYVENHDAARVPVSSKEREERQGKYPYYGASGVIDQIDGYTHQGEYLLLGEDGANLLARSKPIAFLAKGKFWVNNHAHVLKCRGEAPNAYLAYYLNRIDLAPYVTGTAQPKLSQAKMNKIPIPVAPLDQQKPIVAEIEKQFSRLDEAVATLKRVKANLKRYKAAVLKAAVEGKLTEDWRKQHPNVEPANKLLERILAEHRAKWSGRGKYKEPAKSDKSNLPSLPKGWAWCAVNQISRKITDGEHLSPICQPAGIPLLSAKDVRESGVLLDEVKYVSPEDAKRFRMRCDPDRDDILIVSRGATIGRSCAVKTEKMFCLMGSVILIKVCGEISASYILTALKSVSTVKRLVGASGSTAQQAIYIQDIRSLPIPLPPQDEQEQIVAEVERRLSVIEELEVTVEANLTRADRLRQSILQRAFSGRLLSEKGHAGSSDSHLPLLAAESVSPCGVRS